MLLKLDGFDDALVGMSTVWNGNSRHEVLVYSGDKIIEQLVRDGLDEDDAVEHVSFNIEGAYVGPTTPVIVWNRTMQQVDEYVEECEPQEGDSDGD